MWDRDAAGPQKQLRGWGAGSPTLSPLIKTLLGTRGGFEIKATSQRGIWGLATGEKPPEGQD